MSAGSATRADPDGIDPLPLEDAIMISLRLPAALAAMFMGIFALPSHAQTPGPVHARTSR